MRLGLMGKVKKGSFPGLALMHRMRKKWEGGVLPQWDIAWWQGILDNGWNIKIVESLRIWKQGSQSSLSWARHEGADSLQTCFSVFILEFLNQSDSESYWEMKPRSLSSGGGVRFTFSWLNCQHLEPFTTITITASSLWTLWMFQPKLEWIILIKILLAMGKWTQTKKF